MYNIMIVDDHAIVRHGIKGLLEATSSYKVVAECTSLQEVLQYSSYRDVDLVLLDYQLEDGTGSEASAYIKTQNKDCKIILLTAFLNIEIPSSIDAYLLKNIDRTLILETICEVLNYKPLKIDFTDLERKILDEVGNGSTNKEIAETLFLSEKTVRNYLSTIYKKCNVSNRTEAALYWKSNK